MASPTASTAPPAAAAAAPASTAAASTLDVSATAATVANQLYAALTGSVGDVGADASLLANGMTLVEAVPGLTGAQKKAVLLAALDALATTAAASPNPTIQAVAVTARNLVATAGDLIDFIVSLTKPSAPSAAGTAVATDAGTAATEVFSAYQAILATIQTARAGGTLTAASITGLLPGIVQALVAMKAFASAAAADQVTMAQDLLGAYQAAAPASEQPMWAAATASIAPIVYAVAAAKAGTLNVNTVVAAIAANPQQVVSTCVTCISALAAAFGKKS